MFVCLNTSECPAFTLVATVMTDNRSDSRERDDEEIPRSVYLFSKRCSERHEAPREYEEEPREDPLLRRNRMMRQPYAKDDEAKRFDFELFRSVA
ncbi:unnamed protein product [Strongylus vulgaris]|uniref:Uncharacterized protein n=1 Tax=Strongylus vulgaris TaxID=40348 RepID=A0A3P7LP59_STRVU|nr:unnamed protein product [Strongylus vulgaris]